MTQCLVIFDMDGTLTRPMLDFEGIRAEIGLPREPLLEEISRLSPAERARAEVILHRHESEAALNSELQPGASVVVARIRAAGVPVVLMTRNSLQSTEHFERRHGLQFDLVWTRESGPMKPSPEPVLAICARFGVPPARTWVIGDFHFDILCARKAGARSVLFLQPDFDRPPWAGDADYVIRDLGELPALMESDGRVSPAEPGA